MSGRRRGPEFGILLLGSQLIQFGVNRIPPVTLGTIVLNVVAYLYMPYHVLDVCVSTRHVWHDGDLKRLVLGALNHGNDIHLYYNMVSFLWKGTSLERRYKSPYFAYMLVVFTVLADVVLVGLNGLLAQVTGNNHYIHECAVGFSGVVFALKVLTTHYNPPGTSHLIGFIPIPSKWVYWAELVLIQLLVPNASFTGHLAGILVGLAFVKGPLKKIMDMFIPSEPSFKSRYKQSYSGSGSSGYRSRHGNPSYENHGGSSRPQPSAPFGPDVNSNQYYTYGSGVSGYSGEGRETGPRYRPSSGPDPHGWRDPSSRGSTQGSRLYPNINDFTSNYQDYSAGLSQE